MDVYVVGQRLLNFFDNQRINLYKQLVSRGRYSHGIMAQQTVVASSHF